MRRQPVTTDQAGITGQENAALAMGVTDKIVVLTREVLDIIPQNAQPPGQPAEHRIGQEPRSLSASGGRPKITVHARTVTYSPGFFIVPKKSPRIRPWRTAAWEIRELLTFRDFRRPGS